MKQFFANYGKVADATVMVDRESGRSKGFGFVTFEDIPHPEQIIGKIGLVLDDKEVRHGHSKLAHLSRSVVWRAYTDVAPLDRSQDGATS